MRRSARRNKAALVTAGVVAAALVAGTAVSVWQAIRATEAQHQAEADRKKAEIAEGRAATEAAIARAVNNFLQGDLLGQVNNLPGFSDEFSRWQDLPDLTVREALDRAAAKIGMRFQDQPLVEAAIRIVIDQGYQGPRLNAHHPAIVHYDQALKLRQAHLGPDHPDT